MQKKILKPTILWVTTTVLTILFFYYWLFIRYEPVAFRVEGSRAFMSGVIDSTTPETVKSLLGEYPSVKTIVMVDVPGSADDEANLKAARMIRKAGLAVHIPADGIIASGGVDFYLAGSTRTMDAGAKFGVHSWGGADEDGNELIATEIPESHDMHKLYISYYKEIGVDESFYWYTLKAAPAESIHWMTSEEIRQYGITTGDNRAE